MSRDRRITQAEARHLLSMPSPLLPETRRILIDAALIGAGDRLIREGEADDRVTYAEMREWIDARPHVAWCRCLECVKLEVA